MQDWQLLREYTERGSQVAFARLVERYVNFVYTACLREVGDAQLAEDVTQVVFIILAGKARTIRDGTILSGWLFNTARFASKNALRQEARRQQRERKAAEATACQSHLAANAAIDWDALEPHLQAALARLHQQERNAVLLRFFEGKNLKEVATQLGISEAAAKKRVARAVDKMRRYFNHHGFAISATLLAALLTDHAVRAAPVHCVAAATQLSAYTTAGKMTTELVGARVFSTAQGTLKAMLVAQVKTTVLACLSLSVIGASLSAIAPLSRAQSKSPQIQQATPPHPAQQRQPVARRSLASLVPSSGGEQVLRSRQQSLPTDAPAVHFVALRPGLPAMRFAQAPTGNTAESAPAGQSTPSVTKTTELSIRAGEIRFDGAILALYPQDNSFVLEVKSFTLANGKSSDLAVPKPKIIQVSLQTTFQARGVATRKITLDALKPGTQASVVGKDLGSGHNLPARAVEIWFSAAASTAVADGGKSAATPIQKTPLEVPAPEPEVIGAPEIITTPASKPEMDLQLGHLGPPRAMAFSPDSQILATAGWDRTIKLWDMTSMKLLRTLPGHKRTIVTLAFAPDGKTLASGGTTGDGTVKLWDAATGALEQTLQADPTLVTTVAFFKSGAFLATAGLDGSIKIWDTQTGDMLRSLDAHGAVVETLAFSPDGKLLATGSADKTIKIWDASQFKLLRTLTGHSATVKSVAFSPDGMMLASGSNDKTIKLWDVQTGQERQTLTGHSSGVEQVAFSRNGWLASAQPDLVRLWDAAGEFKRTAPAGHTPVAFSPDGQSLACGDGNNIWIWDTAKWEARGHLLGSSAINAVAFSPDGTLLASGSGNGLAQVWDIKTGALKQVLSGHEATVSGVAFAPDGALLVSGSADRSVRLWDVQTGAALKVLRQHGAGVKAVAFAPDNKMFASAGGDGTVWLWGTGNEQGAPLRALSGHQGPIQALSFASDGKTLATGSVDKTIRIWNTQTGVATQTINYEREPWSLTFLPHTLTVAVGGANAQESLKLWDATTGQLTATLNNNLDPIRGIAAAGDGKLIASAGQDGLRLWDALTHQLLWASNDNDYIGLPFAVSLTTDGKKMASVGLDGVVRVWAIGAGTPDAGGNTHLTVRQVLSLLPLPVEKSAPKSPPGFIAFTPEGYYSGSPDADRYIRWRIGNTSYPAASLQGLLHKPELVQQALAGQTLPALGQP